MSIFSKNVTTEKKGNDESVKDILLNSVSEGLVVADENGNVLYSNELAKKIMERGLFGPIDIVSKNTKTVEFDQKYYEAKYKKIPEGNGIKGTIATLSDTAGSVMAADEIRSLKEQLERTENFKSAFLANMSHEIRTPIHAIIGFSEMILKEGISESFKKQINMIKDSSYSLLGIINDVLDLTKIESGRMELVCSNYYISYVIRDIDATYSLLAAKKNLTFEMHLDNNIPSYMYGDKIRIRGILINLINNAIKYTEKGRVDFYIKVLEKRDGVVTLKFIVKDTGVGIRQEDLDKIFESFSKFEINNDYSIEGRGIGLSITKGYLDLMGGKISVESEYGKGSSFTVTLTQKIIDDSPVDMGIVNARKKNSDERMSIKNTRVLVVDDNTVNLSVAEGLMKTYDLNVVKASSGQEAIDICRKVDFDIIFMDQMMPKIDGVMAMKQIRKINTYYEKKCIIIVLTADAMAGVRDRLLEEGFDEYLCKPLEIHRLEMALRKFVPSENISTVPITENESIIIEKSDARVVEQKASPTDEISYISENIGIGKDVLKRKIKDCGGTLGEYVEVCALAKKHSGKRMEKLRESFGISDYDRYAIEVHSLKSSMAMLGNMGLSTLAKEQENACENGDYDFVVKTFDELMDSYKGFIEKIGKYVLKEDAGESSENKNEEWNREEIAKVIERITTLVDEFNFAPVYEIFEDLRQIDMGMDTRKIFEELEEIMNDMDIEKLKERLGEYK